MNAENTPVVVYVYYRGTPQTRFDRHYYIQHHLPLVMKSWQRHGLISASAFYPAVAHSGTLAICECVFENEAAMEASFNSPESPEVMADVQRYTDATPLRVRAVAL
ncbi:ethyl tert-butyl ether degradation protein EthD [Bordetella genomosp. 8]|uniref:Ethyl tert-butyl ether degradation protein EthD n=1 Tax=Bordetella genomosp. 8 TaxID=1416806 RepID=A0A1W6YMF7_9BORD|nr:EthD family reductase [Bordetella genomosp. 8]ARP82290.1 ethyl tert-butyl ether degradation protein EthD [Bordetella genomosp. 8]